MTNTKGQPIYDLLRKAGLPVQGVVVLGVFCHVECECEDTARKVARLMQRGGFNFERITKRIDRAKHQNESKAACGMSTWVTRWTAHFKAA